MPEPCNAISPTVLRMGAPSIAAEKLLYLTIRYNSGPTTRAAIATKRRGNQSIGPPIVTPNKTKLTGPPPPTFAKQKIRSGGSG